MKKPNKDNCIPAGGKLDPFENTLKAAIRETFEEVEIKMEIMKYCGILTEISPTKYNWIRYIYTAEIDFVGSPFCNEDTFMWISFDELLNVSKPKTDWYIYKYILDGKPFALSAKYNEEINLFSIVEEIENKK